MATDSTLYQSQVFAASHGDTSSRSPRRKHTTTWGDRPVLLLLGIRLGIEGVNPIYYETIKVNVASFVENLNFTNTFVISASVHLPTVCGNRWRTSKFIVLLRRFTGRQFVLPRPAQPKTRHSTPHAFNIELRGQRTRSFTIIRQRQPTTTSATQKLDFECSTPTASPTCANISFICEDRVLKLLIPCTCLSFAPSTTIFEFFGGFFF